MPKKGGKGDAPNYSKPKARGLRITIDAMWERVERFLFGAGHDLGAGRTGDKDETLRDDANSDESQGHN